MRVVIVVMLLLLAPVADLFARDVRVFIAPRSSMVPRSGKVLFDVYWINDGRRPAAIPALQRYSFTYLPLGPTATTATAFGLSMLTADHPSADRRLAPGAVARDSATVDIDAKGADLVQIAAEFRGDRSTFKSNTVVLRTRR